MISEARYQVFVSSTYEDLRIERQQATQAILEMNHMPAGMELFPASDLSQWELIKTVINESDYYIVIVGGRYGSVHQDTGISFTEMEYDYAVEQSVPILGFVRKNIAEIRSRDVESDATKRTQLEKFRQKVKSRTCRTFDEPNELGMLVMKSLMNETRTNPRVGWVRADQARGKEDIEREQLLMDEITNRDKAIKKLERQIRDRVISLDEFSLEDLAQGSDLYAFTVTFSEDKKPKCVEVNLTWDEIFSVIGPRMYGYIIRRGEPRYGILTGEYSFEPSIVEFIRTKILDQCGTKKIAILSHQIDAVLIQFKQLGLMHYVEKTANDDGKDFRGYSLTEAGEAYLTRLKVQLR
jgi:hypothetical protein